MYYIYGCILVTPGLLHQPREQAEFIIYREKLGNRRSTYILYLWVYTVYLGPQVCCIGPENRQITGVNKLSRLTATSKKNIDSDVQGG